MDLSLSDNGDACNDLGKIVLSWTISTITNEQPVKKIPRSFSSTKECLESYQKPLIEETRSELMPSLRSIFRSQYYRLLSISKANDSMYFLDIDTSFEAGVSHVPQNGDVFLISTKEPKDLSPDNDAGIFAMAIDVAPHEYYCKSFHVRTENSLSSNELKFAVFLCNITANPLVWKTLHLDMSNSAIINKILKPLPSAENSCDIYLKQLKASDLPNVLLNQGLDTSQRDLAVSIASSVKCCHHESMRTVWGPSGTGKTKVISKILECFQGSETKILICAPTVSSFTSLCSYMPDSISRSKGYDGLPADRVGEALLICDEVEAQSAQLNKFCMDYRLKKMMPCSVHFVYRNVFLSL